MRLYDVRVNRKAEATAAIERAQTELRAALVRLAELPALDSDRLTYAAHALNNYLMVVSTIAHLLRATLGKSSEAEIRDRLESLDHATKLMKQVVRQLIVPQGEDRPNLIYSAVDLRKSCHLLGFLILHPKQNGSSIFFKMGHHHN